MKELAFVMIKLLYLKYWEDKTILNFAVARKNNLIAQSWKDTLEFVVKIIPKVDKFFFLTVLVFKLKTNKTDMNFLNLFFNETKLSANFH